ncbi:MAG: Gfo/Idh/MocA family oxidoreductase, partial [Planctomycetes bacterium]|nr:Gfo/Idh/MocA family oxidoreductase [Planctomycetota bacterium]
FWFHQHPRCIVTAVTDLREDRRQALIRQYGCKDAFPSLEVMMEKAAGTFDAVAIYSGAPDHAKHVILCMEAKKDVLCAVPAAISLEDCARLKEVKERTGVRYMMAESSWYRQEAIAAREMYRDGKFGRLVYSEVEYYHPGIGRKGDGLSFFQGKPTWRLGLPPMFYPTHSTGFLVGVTGERITHVSCLGTPGGPDFPKPEETVYRNPFANEMALCRTSGGNISRVGVFWHVAAEGERAQWLGEKMSAYMGGSGGQPQSLRIPGKGVVAWDVPAYWKTDRLPEAMRHASGHGGSAVFISAEFIDAIVQGREPEIDLYHSLAMTAPGLVAHQSALRGGVQLEVPNYDKSPS